MFLRASAWLLTFDGDDDAAAAAAAKVAADKAAADKAAAAAAAEGDQTFTQDEVNSFLAAEKRKDQERQRVLVSELEGLKRESNLTKKQRTDLEKRIEDLQNQYMTTEEKARQEAERKQKEYDGELKTALTERDDWQKKHSTLAISTDIAHAAVDHDAVDFEQIAALLSPKTKLVEKLDEEGQPTGSFEPKVSFDDVDKEKKPIILELTVNEAVGRMRELPKYANLFRTDKTGGLGSQGSAASGKKIDLAKIARENPTEYRRIRREQPELLG